MKRTSKPVIILSLSIYTITIIAPFILLVLILFNSKIEINTDITKYNEYIGKTAKEEYKNKMGMDESIFPQTITNNMNIIDYKMVYYDPWDAQYLSYLVVSYNEKDYQNEIKRLKEYESTKYKDYYSVTGFDKYKLVAIYADDYGFIYAITDNKNKIIYVELIFCNYYYDLDYEKYINNDYLPNGFNAKNNNPYQKKKLKEN